jgi:hypothetical protein
VKAQLAAVFLVVSGLVYSALKIEAIFSSEESVNFQQTTKLYIPEGSSFITSCKWSSIPMD